MTHPLLDWITRHHPQARATLRAPARQSEIDREQLPSAFAELYRVHDGQAEGPMKTSFFDEAFRWLSIKEARSARALMISVIDDVRKEFPESEPFRPTWFPFAADDLGNLWVVDTVTDEVFAHEHDAGRVEGEPLTSEAFLNDYLARLESGALVLDEKLGIISRKALETPPVPRPAPSLVTAIAYVASAVLALVIVAIWFEMRR